eukprot:996850-Prorocentrum_minimum.AAC.7
MCLGVKTASNTTLLLLAGALFSYEQGLSDARSSNKTISGCNNKSETLLLSSGSGVRSRWAHREYLTKLLSFLYQKYEPEHYYWDVLLLLRRAAFGLIIGLDIGPHLQGLVAVIILGGAMLAHGQVRAIN